MRIIVVSLSLMAVLAVSAVASADTITFREGTNGVVADDTTILISGPLTINSSVLEMRGNTSTTLYASLLAFKDMMTALPATVSGQVIVIDSATLTCYRNFGGVGDGTQLYRVTTNWLSGAAGTNEANVSGTKSNVANGTDWLSGTTFGTSDYNTGTVASVTLASAVYDSPVA
ncbi:MAG: hypothetical protein EHM48_09660, partial [Planctomycetaceae bacterium]